MRLCLAAVLAAVLCACEAPDYAAGFEGEAVDERAWAVDAHQDCDVRPSRTRARDGEWSLRISAPPKRRCEVVPRMRPPLVAVLAREPFGKERWYRFSVFVESLGDYPPPDGLGDNTIVAQWHSSPDYLPAKERGRGPPLALRIYDGKWGITYGSDPRFRSDPGYRANNWFWLGPVETGRWVDWAFRVVWSHEEDGFTQVYKDGDIVMEREGPNAFNDLRGVYLKLGLYHPTADQVIHLDSVSLTGAR